MSESKVTHKGSWITRNYGSRRGGALTHWHRLLGLLGRYRSFRQVDWGRVERLVFVCTGNICRSPYAEAVARSLGIETISCGIDTVTGAPANEDAIKVGATRGFDLSKHKTTPIQTQVFSKSDLLIAMEPWQAGFLLKEFATEGHSLLGLWGEPVTPYIHDPYGASPDYFDNCFSYIENAVYRMSKTIDEAKH